MGASRRVIRARQVRGGMNVLTDPLDVRTAWSVADVSRSQYADSTELVLYRAGDLASVRLMNDDPVTVVSDEAAMAAVGGTAGITLDDLRDPTYMALAEQLFADDQGAER